MFDLQRVRRDAPGCTERAFLDSAGSSLPPEPVLDTMATHLRREAQIGGYLAAAERSSELAAVKQSLATLIGAAGPHTIALSDGASRSWTDFFYSVPLTAGDRVLISEVEYAANAIAALQRARVTGASVEVIPSDSVGQIDLDALDHMLDERVRLVSLVHIPTNGGLVNPVREVVEVAHRVGALVLLDACQSVGQVAVDVGETGVDALSATGRKWLRGPRGTGFLYLRAELAATMEPARLDLHSGEWTGPTDYRLAPDARRFEFWEAGVAARLGLGSAVDYLLELGPGQAFAEIAERGRVLREALTAVDGVTVRDLGSHRGGIVTFTVEGHDPHDIRVALAAEDIIVTVSGRGSTVLDMDRRGLESVVRASPHYFTSPEDLDRMVGAVAGLAE